MDNNGQNKNYNKIEYCLGSGLELLSAPTDNNLVFNLFSPSLAYISNHALSFLFTFVKGYSITAESLYFS